MEGALINIEQKCAKILQRPQFAGIVQQSVNDIIFRMNLKRISAEPLQNAVDALCGRGQSLLNLEPIVLVRGR